MRNSKEDGKKPSESPKIKKNYKKRKKKSKPRHTCATMGWGSPDPFFCTCGPEQIKECKEMYKEVQNGETRRRNRKRNRIRI